MRPGHSTGLKAGAFITELLEYGGCGHITSTIFVDLRKGFDTIYYTILLKKLELYGGQNNAYECFTSYLIGRQQRTMVNGVNSDYNTSTHGVPQGSVLGPMLFLLYINDVTNVIDPNSIYLYADDTVLFESGINGVEVQTRLQSK